MNEKERKSCIFTIKTLMNLAYNIHGVMDVVDVDNCKKIIEMLGSGYLAGRWIEHENADIVDGYYVPKYECSCCHTWKRDDSDYCPDCGADMRGDKYETD